MGKRNLKAIVRLPGSYREAIDQFIWKNKHKGKKEGEGEDLEKLYVLNDLDNCREVRNEDRSDWFSYVERYANQVK
ncbi:MAG: hypothetical protein HXP06_01535, partial [Trueperella pyogenes]|nr:hypothetical protein [Trueperella pyogenes]